MFPDINDFDKNDFRQLILYSWKFELNAIESLIEITSKDMEEKRKELHDLSVENLDNYIHEECMKNIIYLHETEMLAFQSFFLTIYSVVEASLDRYCEICKRKFELKIGLEDLKDKGITRAINYLEKVVDMEEIKYNDMYRKMKLINKLRNDIIHKAGYISEKGKIEIYKEELELEVIDGKIKFICEDIKRLYKYMDDFIKLIFSKKIKSYDENFNSEEFEIVESIGEFYKENRVVILKLKDQEIKIGDFMYIKRNEELIKLEILEIQLNGKTVTDIKDEEVGIRFKDKLKNTDLFYLKNKSNIQNMIKGEKI
ncbi:hypothetical protein [Haliovirga abyssi]|uniref:RiboL-PSP-HEPN domain-containing protein n=1 Tax=Haliovirga abyssi TaxID=2996794 RepID=A0AAU9D348_9FUSO|nr:hypothetical protein [Haliovirga abyssi]BDU50396.1 hypothetical protein HLVA_09650 [Haliovirga abyssi]